MMGRISGRMAILLSVVGVLVVLVGGWVVLVSPERAKAGAAQAQIDDAQAKLTSTKAYLANRANRRSLEELRRLQALLPDSVQMSQVLRQLSAAAAESGVKIVSVAPAAPNPLGSGQQIPINLSINGHYFNVARFVHLLEAKAQTKSNSVIGDGRLYSVGSLGFTGGGAATGASSQNVLTVAVALNVYSYGGAVAPAAPTTSNPSSDSSTSTDTSTTGS